MNNLIRHYVTIYFRNLRSIDEQIILELAFENEIIPLTKSNSSYRYTFESSSEKALIDFLDELHEKGYYFLHRSFSK